MEESVYYLALAMEKELYAHMFLWTDNSKFDTIIYLYLFAGIYITCKCMSVSVL